MNEIGTEKVSADDCVLLMNIFFPRKKDKNSDCDFKMLPE